MTEILYVGSFKFPVGDPACPRVLGIGKALREAGYGVTFVGTGSEGRLEDRQLDGSFAFQGFPYLPETATVQQMTGPKRVWHQYYSGQATLDRLDGLACPQTRALIAYHPSALLLWRLQGWCRRRGIALIADTTEWYDPQRISGGPFGPYHLDHELRMRWVHPRVGKLIVISSWLERHYTARGCQVLRVPPLVDLADAKWQVARTPTAPGDPLRIVFSGVPDRERVDLLLRALQLVPTTDRKLVVEFMGFPRERLLGCDGVDTALLASLDDRLVFHGRLPVEQVMPTLARADFGIIFRYHERSTEACFPTKVPEYLAMGIPIIANLTTDLGEYLTDGVNGFVVPADTPEALAAVFTRALDCTPAEREALRAGARQTAADRFDYHQYIAPLSTYLDAVAAATRPVAGKV